MKTIREAELENKKVIVRVDYNVPIENGIIIDDSRILESFNTIKFLKGKKAKIILMSHLGKVKEKKYKEKYSLKIISKKLEELLGEKIYFINTTRGKKLENKINDLKEKEILLIENTRFEDLNGNKESSCDEELSKYWASLGDIFVLDAFGSCHRNHASTYGIGKYIPSYAGFLVEKEIDVLKIILKNNNKDLILGGAKVEDKIKVIENLIDKSNHILIGGVMAFTFLKAIGYSVGPNIVEESMLEEIKDLYNSFKDKIILPVDFKTPSGLKDINNLNDYGYDIGPKTLQLFKNILKSSELVVWNGPLGKFEDENYELGTKEILEYLNNQKLKTVIAGGDTGSAAHKYNLNFYYISTGGGATLEYLSGKVFKTLENIK